MVVIVNYTKDELEKERKVQEGTVGTWQVGRTGCYKKENESRVKRVN